MIKRKISLPAAAREAAITSFNAEENSAEMIFSTGAQVRRFDFFMGEFLEEIELSEDAADLSRAEKGVMPFLKNHGGMFGADIEDVMGRVTVATVKNSTEAVATVKFSEREDVAPFVKDIKNGILSAVSMGFRINRLEKTGELDGTPILRATKWELMEVSSVAIPADPGAAMRKAHESGKRTAPKLHSCELIGFSEAELGAIDKRVAEYNKTLEGEAARSLEEIPVVEPKKVNERVESQEDLPEDQNTQGEIAMATEDLKIENEAAKKREAEAAKKREAEAVKKATEVERERISGIRKACTVAKLGEDFSAKLIENGTPVDEARSLVIDELAKRDAEPKTETRSTVIEAGNLDATVTRREGAMNAIMSRANPGKYKVEEKGREYRNMSLLRLAEEFVGRGARGMGKAELVTRALSTSDFAELLANTQGKVLLDAYQLAPQTFRAWTRAGTLPDFKEASRISFGDIESLQEVKEGGEYTYSSIGEAAEKIKLLKYGKAMKITWETLINDDLDAFSRVPVMMGNAARRKESALVYTDTLLANPLMDQDGVALFDAAHGNLGAALAVAEPGMSDMREKMRQQTTVDGEDFLDLDTAFLLVGPEQETAARKILSGEVLGSTSADVNIFRNSHQLIVEPRITGLQWYGSAQPGVVDTLEVATLEGGEGMQVMEEVAFNGDFVKTKIRHVVGVKAIDYRGLYKNPGA